MRAMMSDRQARREYGLGFTWRGTGYAQFMAAGEAEHEARAILAETEPANQTRAFDSAATDGLTYDGLRCDELSALAESLAAFVARDSF